MGSFSDLAEFSVEEVGITHKFTREAAKYDDLVVIYMRNSATLSVWEINSLDIDQAPRLASLVVILFNRVAVLLASMSNAAKHKHESVRKRATCVVMSANIQRWHVVPQVQVDVVLLAALESLVGVNARTGDNQKLIL